MTSSPRSSAKQPARTRSGARSGAARSNAKRGASRSGNARRQPSSDTGSKASKLGTKLRWIHAARERLRALGQRVVQRATAFGTGEGERQWPRRLGLFALKFGGAMAVAWALLVAGREVYDYATTSARFEVRHFIYEPSAHVADESLRELLAIDAGTNILALDLSELSEQIAAHPWVAHATVIRNLPDTLEIEIVEHEPVAIVLAERFYLVGSDAKVFKQVERGERGELPIITGIERSELADAREGAEQEIAKGLEILDLYLAKQRPRLAEVHLGDEGSVTLYTVESGTQLLLGREDFDARLQRWDALRVALGERAERLAVVHLDHESKPDRRDRVVARFTNDHDEAVVLAEAKHDAEPEETDSEAASAASVAPEDRPARRAGRRDRIPRYE